MQNNNQHSGTLYVVATPLGNLDDMTLRAIKTLQQVDAIACEDTRRTSILLNHLQIVGKKLISYHNYNEPKAIARVVSLLEEGSDVALVTDAGTPLVSDPGYSLLHALYERELPVIPVPGASALTAALSACPLPTSSFLFVGFLPHKKGRKSRLDFLASQPLSFVLYESPYRIMRLLDELEAVLPAAKIFIGREMTKLHEEYLTGTIDEVRQQLTNSSTKGEFVVIVYPSSEQPEQSHQHEEHHENRY